MAKTKSRTAPAPKLPETPNADNPGALPPDADTRGAQSTSERFNEWEEGKILALLKNEIGGTGQITLQRRHPSGGMPSWTYTGTPIPVDGFTIASVAAMFGGGDYRAKVRTSNGQIARDFSFSVDHSIPPKNPAAGHGPEREKPERLDIPGIMRELRESLPKAPDQGGLVEIVKAALQRPEPKGETAALLEMVKEIREESRRSEDRFLKMIEKMNERNQPAPALSLREQLEEAKELMELMGGGGNGREEKRGPWWQELGKGLGEAVIPMLQQHFAGGGGPPVPGSRALPAPAGALTSPPASNPPAGNGDAIDINPPTAGDSAPNGGAAAPDMKNPLITAALANFRRSALAAAVRNADAYEFVEATLAIVPAAYLGRIYETANGAEWFSTIFGNDAEPLKHTAFLNTVREAVLMKSFVSHTLRCVQPGNIAAADCAKSFLDWNARDFDDALLSAAENADVWADVFATEQIPAAWLEELRAAVIAELGGDATAAPVVEMPKANDPAQSAAVNSRVLAKGSKAQQKPKAGG